MFDILKRKATTLLRWSERYTKTDMVYLASGGFWLSVSNVLGATTSFVSSIAFANWLPQEVYGVFRYVISMLPNLTIPTLNGIDTAVTRAVAQGKESTVYPALSLKMRWGVWGTICTLALAIYYYLQGDIRLMFLFLIVAVFIPFMEPFNLFVAFLTGRSDFKMRAYYGAITRIVPTLVLVAIVFFTSNIFILIGGYFISYTIVRLVVFRWTIQAVPVDGEVDRTALGFGKHLSAMSILTTLSLSLDSILIFHFGGAIVLAGYYLAMVPLKQVWNIFSSITTLALPKLSLRNSESLIHSLPQKVWKLTLLMILVVLAYVMVAPLFFSLLYPKYIAYVYLSDFFMLQMLFLPTGLFSAALTAQGEKNKLYILSITNATTRIILLLILTPLFGLWGAASAIVINGLIASILKTYTFYRL